MLRAEGRISIRTFSRELLRAERKVVGLYDATITATDPFPIGIRSKGPIHALGLSPAYTMAVNRLLRSDIGVETDREYAVTSYEVNTAWKIDTEHHALAPPPGATDDFRYGMSLNPHLKAFVTHGRYDLVTPYFASDRLRNLMKLDPQMAERLTVRHFGGGHVLLLGDEPSRVHGGDRVLRRRGHRVSALLTWKPERPARNSAASRFGARSSQLSSIRSSSARRSTCSSRIRRMGWPS